MAKVFLLPDGFEAPEFDWQEIEKYKKDCADHTSQLCPVGQLIAQNFNNI